MTPTPSSTAVAPDLWYHYGKKPAARAMSRQKVWQATCQIGTPRPPGMASPKCIGGPFNASGAAATGRCQIVAIPGFRVGRAQQGRSRNPEAGCFPRHALRDYERSQLASTGSVKTTSLSMHRWYRLLN